MCHRAYSIYTLRILARLSGHHEPRPKLIAYTGCSHPVFPADRLRTLGCPAYVVHGLAAFAQACGSGSRGMDADRELNGHPLDPAASNIDYLDAFDSFWQSEEPVLSRGPSPSGHYLYDEEQQRQSVERHGGDNTLQPVDSLQTQHDDHEETESLAGILYTVEWKAVLKTKRIGMDTEQDVDLAPEVLWETILRKKVGDLLDREFPPQERPEPGDTVIVVSVSKRAERDLTKQFPGFDIGWSVIEEKLESWTHHYRAGENLTLKITFRFRPHSTAVQGSSRARGRQSATQRMRQRQAFQRDAEEHATGEAAFWRTVYRVMRCPGRPCPHGSQYCLRDSSGNHLKLLTAHLRQLVVYMQQGNRLETQNDVPDNIKQELYAEASQRTRRRNNQNSPLTTPHNQSCLPPSIMTPASQTSPEPTPTSGCAVGSSILERLDIPGSHEDAIRDYVQWHQDQSDSEEWISHYAKAGDILLKQGYKLGLFYQLQRIDILTGQGVLDGIALSFHSDIPDWLPGYRQRCADATQPGAPSID